MVDARPNSSTTLTRIVKKVRWIVLADIFCWNDDVGRSASWQDEREGGRVLRQTNAVMNWDR